MTTSSSSSRPAHAITEERVRAFLDTEIGRETLRRDVEECGQVKPGQNVLVLLDDQAPPGTAYLVDMLMAMLAEMGTTPILIRLPALIPLHREGMPGSFSDVAEYHIARPVYEAIKAADVIFDYSASGRGAQKYNVDIYELAHTYNKHIVGRRAIEAPEVLWSMDGAYRPNEEALSYPPDLLRIISDKINAAIFDAAIAGQEIRLTNPWGTDLRFTTLPGDVGIPAGGIRRYPRTEPFYGDDGNRLYRTVVGTGLTQKCEGVWVTRFCSLIGGELAEPIRITYDRGAIVNVEDGRDAARMMERLAGETSMVHAILFGVHPKVRPFRGDEFMLANDGAGMGVAHIGMGGPGLFFRAGEWGRLGSTHYQTGNIPKISVWAGDQQLYADGRLLALDAPDVREAARRFGDPDELLRPFGWPEVV